MRITGPRLGVALGVALGLQAVVFAWRYQDLIYFRKPVDAITATGSDSFEQHAVEALGRSRITKQNLETIANAAETLKSPAVELRALERAVKTDPTDTRLKLKLADALRRSGQLPRAEALYADVLKNGKGGGE